MNDLPPALRKLRLTEGEASAYLAEAYGVRTSPATLRTWRSRRPDYGPPFEHYGRSVMYRRLALDVWAQGRLRPSDPGRPDR